MIELERLRLRSALLSIQTILFTFHSHLTSHFTHLHLDPRASPSLLPSSSSQTRSVAQSTEATFSAHYFSPFGILRSPLCWCCPSSWLAPISIVQRIRLLHSFKFVSLRNKRCCFRTIISNQLQHLFVCTLSFADASAVRHFHHQHCPASLHLCSPALFHSICHSTACLTTTS